MQPVVLKPSHKAFQAYYEALQAYGAQGVTHESAVRSAFQNLLTETGKVRGWALVPELGMKVGGKTVRPDGTLRDEWFLPRGYWEAKDTSDKLDDEVRAKIAKGYPLGNTIFEDTTRAVLFQKGHEVFRADLSDRQQLADLLNQFYDHAEPDIAGFEQAVGEFQERIPDLAKGLLAKIVAAHSDVPKFQAAFDAFLGLCQTALNPNIRPAAVDEMLIQHLLTERLFRKVFQNPEFTRRNVIAVEIERVIDALASTSFNRDDFLKSLDRFYRAIEAAAHNLDDFAEKQHFLNSVYERFFQGYSVQVADTHGIVYTPQPIVDFMCASVAAVLADEFGLSLGAPGVTILDPCTGTGNFIVNLLRRIPKRDLPRAYRSQLFANEIMLFPYYIAALNIEHAYYELTGSYEPFEGLCFVDTLELAEGPQAELSFMTEANTVRVKREKAAPITVVIGNPPYNMGQMNENDNNKNRRYSVVDRRISETYSKDSRASLKNKLYDAYVKFFRWAVDRLHDRDGIVCFIRNNSFIDQISFDGMRKHLMQDFTRIYHIDLHGDVRKNPKLSGTAHNVFGIQVSVGITIGVRSSKHSDHRLYYHRVPENWRKEEKLAWLAGHQQPSDVSWTELVADGRNAWLVSENADEYAGFIPTIAENGEAIFELCSLGIATNRDEWVYDFSAKGLGEKSKRHITNYNYEVFRLSQEAERPADLDTFVNNDPSFLKWTDRLKVALSNGRTLTLENSLIRKSIYRPFVKKLVYFDHLLVHRRYQQHRIFPISKSDQDNNVIVVSQIGYRSGTYNSLMTNCIPDLHLCASVDGHQCFPFYVSNEDGSHRRENITDWALERFQFHYGDKSIAKWEIFYYVYGVLHVPGYRDKFAADLKRELPRVPYYEAFRAIVAAGRALAGLHLDYETVEPWPLRWVEAVGKPLSYRVEKMRLSKDKSALVVNDSLTLADIPATAFEYRLGNRSALEWVVDQYQVSEDKHSGLRSDPNRADDPEAIVRLVGQVVRVSLATVQLIHDLEAAASRPSPGPIEDVSGIPDL